MSFNWQCPYCARQVSLTENSYQIEKNYLLTRDKGKDGDLNYEVIYIVCPNPECKEYTVKISFYKRENFNNEQGRTDYRNGEQILSTLIKPRGMARPFPDYIPKQLRDDYGEACLILHDSSKASATLSRRCLQGIIRQYYKIIKATLYEEIQALKGVVSESLWQAIDSIREVGNIGAHSPKDVSIIIDVPFDAAKALIELIELLFEETYIRDFERQSRIDKAVTAAANITARKIDDGS